MAARPLRRAICAGAKKGTAVAPAVVALRTIAALRFALAVVPLQARFKRLLRVRQSDFKRLRAVLLRALLRLVVFALPSSYTARV